MDEVLKNAILNGLYSQNYLGHEALNPQILLNNDVNNIWFTLRRELLTCKSFDWTVAFITQDMLVPLKAVLEDLAVKGIKGTLITGTYQGFNDPKAFAELQKIPNLTVRIAEMPGFHAKGYLFNHGNYQTAIIGSANFTRAALLSNYEWSLKISSRENSALLEQINQEFAFLRKNSFKLSNEWLETYKRNWQPIKRSEKLNISQKIKPNRMQKAALEEIKAMIKGNKKRALVVSATGTGKTYLGAFSVKDYKPKRFLYVVHREQIAQKALSSFKKVIGGDNADYGLLVGGHTDINAKYLFATVQTLSQP